MRRIKENKIDELKQDWENIAEEPLDIEKIKGAIYAFGSELAVLRLFYYFRYTFKDTENVRIGQSGGDWYFSLKVNF